MVKKITLLICLLSLSLHVLSDELSDINSLYQTLLDEYAFSAEKNGKPANMINFAVIKNDPRLSALTYKLQNYPKERLDTQAKKISFYLNAYNILSIAKVAEHWPIKRLKALGSFMRPVWTHPVGEVCGELMTLRKLEHEVLRTLGEPRIHFALNCASMSCPDLRLEPYRAETLEQQLEGQLKVFMSQSRKGVLIKAPGLVKLSPIFKWFSEDFDSLGGVEKFIQPYLPVEHAPWKVVGYLNYDWDVNANLSGSEKQRIKRRARSTMFNR